MSKKRIGLLLSAIHTTTSVDYYRNFVQKAQQSDQTLLIFPGGRLNFEKDYEYLRNAIYPLINENNVDFLINWGSSLGGKTTLNDITLFLKNFESIPYITLCHKMENHSNITFDAYTCMKDEIIHLIEVHHCKKIAFLRGPQNHKSAQERYAAYFDVLKLKNYEIDENLISDPFPWNESKKAIQQLCEERTLLPSKDFEAIVCANDAIMFASMDYLYSLNYSIPQDVKIVGFNDSKEALRLPSPGTTAKMPLDTMCQVAWKLALQGKDNGGDYNFPCSMVIRKSCGCLESFSIQKMRAIKDYSLDDFYDAASYILDIPSSAIVSIVQKVRAVTTHIEAEKFEIFFSFQVYTYLKKKGDIYALYEVLTIYLELFSSAYIKNSLYFKLLEIIQNTKNRIENEQYYIQEREKTLLTALKSDLFTTKTIKEVILTAESHLQALEVDEMHVVFFDSAYSSCYKGGFKNQHYIEQINTFPKNAILPHHLSDYSSGCYIILPLFTANKSLGYLFIHTTNDNGETIENVRSILNTQITTTLFFAEAKKANERAQKAEKVKSLFFANINDVIKDSIFHIQKIPEIKHNKELQKYLKRTTDIITLSNLELEEVELTIRTVNLNEILSLSTIPSNTLKKAPILVLDHDKLLDALKDLYTFMTEASHSLRITDLTPQESNVRVSLTSDASFEQFSETLIFRIIGKIVYLLKGSITIDHTKMTLSFPYPSFSNNKENYGTKEYYFTNATIKKDTSISPKQILQQGLPSHIKKIHWDLPLSSFESQYILKMIGKEAPTADFICYDIPLGYKSIAMALAQNNQEDDKKVIYYCGTLPPQMKQLQTIATLIAFQSNNQLNAMMLAKKPQLILMINHDDLFFNHIAQGDFNNSLLIAFSHAVSYNGKKMENMPDNVLYLNTFVLENVQFIQTLSTFLVQNQFSLFDKSKKINDAIQFMNGHAKNTISRWQISEYVGISDDYLSKIFKQEIGISPWTYLTLLRMSLVDYLLSQTKKTISEIANETGFQNQAYLCRVYKKIKKETPNSYRKKCCVQAKASFDFTPHSTQK